MGKTGFTRRECLTLVMVAAVNMFCSTTVSLQAPFYPAEAEKKGATATEYGFVFGSYELTSFLASPRFGKIVEKRGPKCLLGLGMLVSSAAIITFGFVDLISNRVLFIGISLLLRIIESLGACSAVVAGFSLTASVFPDKVATVFATMEMFYGAGFIIGPTIGGLLYSVGGFPLPFIVVGMVTAIIGFVILCVIPDVSEATVPLKNQNKLMTALRVPSIAFDIVSVVAFASAVGFYNATLEPFLSGFGLSTTVISFIFITSGGTYAIVSPFMGRIADKYIEPKTLLIIGCLLNIISFSIVGPLPFLPLPSTLIGSIIALFLNGLALGAGIVSTFIDSFKSAKMAGLPDDIGTYGIIAGLWTSAYAFGGFIGPTVAGVLYDLVGFRWATLFMVSLFLILASTLLVFIPIERRQRLRYEKLLSSHSDDNENIHILANGSNNQILL